MHLWYLEERRSKFLISKFFIVVILFSLFSCSPAVPVPKKTGGLWYEFKSGDTLEGISKRYGVSKLDIKKANDIYDEKDLNAGTRILIPNAKQPVEASRSLKKTKRTPDSPAAINLIWPAAGTISSGYGLRQGRMHYGIDITKDKGRDIVAAAAGIVEFAGRKNGFGNLIIINHGKRVKTYYAHNSKLYIRKKTAVRQGQLIARMGATGKAKGIHLHFEVRVKGKSQNPLRYLPVR